MTDVPRKGPLIALWSVAALLLLLTSLAGRNFMAQIPAPSSSSSSQQLIAGICGNSTRNAGEQCDDGNTANGDGCSSACKTETGFLCSEGLPAEASPVCDRDTPSCSPGGGAVQCPPSHPVAGCRNNFPFCLNQSDPNTAALPTCAEAKGKDICISFCGDSVRASNEQCDDGNVTDGDGCSPACFTQAVSSVPAVTQSSAGSSGSPGPTAPPPEPAACGDGNTLSPEQCDDGNLRAGDGCSATCTVEQGWTCEAAEQSACPMCSAECGAQAFVPQSPFTAQLSDGADLLWSVKDCVCTANGAAECKITIRNNGPKPAPNVRMFLSVTGDGVIVKPETVTGLTDGTTTVPKLRSNTKTVNWGNGGTLPAKAAISGTITFNTEVDVTASLQSDTPDPERSNDNGPLHSPACKAPLPAGQFTANPCTECRTFNCPGTGLSVCRSLTQETSAASSATAAVASSAPAAQATSSTLLSGPGTASSSGAKPLDSPTGYCCVTTPEPVCSPVSLSKGITECPGLSAMFLSQEACTLNCKPPSLVGLQPATVSSSSAGLIILKPFIPPESSSSLSIALLPEAPTAPEPEPLIQISSEAGIAGTSGSVCTASRECLSALCIAGKCVACVTDSDCAPGKCESGQCRGTCGNGVIEAREECDAGKLNSNSLPDHCRTTCKRPVCGDGVQDSGERCDDGNETDDPACDHLCRQGTMVQSKQVTVRPAARPSPSTLYEEQPQAPQLIQKPLGSSQLAAIATSNPPSGSTGPFAITVMAAGAAAGWAYVRKRK